MSASLVVAPPSPSPSLLLRFVPPSGSLPCRPRLSPSVRPPSSLAPVLVAPAEGCLLSLSLYFLMCNAAWFPVHIARRRARATWRERLVRLPPRLGCEFSFDRAQGPSEARRAVEEPRRGKARARNCEGRAEPSDGARVRATCLSLSSSFLAVSSSSPSSLLSLRRLLLALHSSRCMRPGSGFSPTAKMNAPLLRSSSLPAPAPTPALQHQHTHSMASLDLSSVTLQ